jgi:hypothetical protein
MPPFNLHFPENGWEKITQNGSAWWAGELERALIIPSISLHIPPQEYYFYGILGR